MHRVSSALLDDNPDRFFSHQNCTYMYLFELKKDHHCYVAICTIINSDVQTLNYHLATH